MPILTKMEIKVIEAGHCGLIRPSVDHVRFRTRIMSCKLILIPGFLVLIARNVFNTSNYKINIIPDVIAHRGSGTAN